MIILVTGSSGYLGQFIVAALAAENQTHEVRLVLSAEGVRMMYIPIPPTTGCPSLQVVATWMSRDPGAPAGPSVKHVQCDLADAESVALLFSDHTFDAVVNTAALSQPGACESNPAAARCCCPSRSIISLLRD